ncbi:MAG: hypothetical protein IPN02_06690 [Candidatus Microthrix sp.]|uniref:Uncharacterized protein n=1 Tax=Candidatus Neomicrothrix subdominans TaxID=2954438 RepID=A0A936TDY8_9ACTN|nr:hypothetical protein [Candidatus Microthrix subdominans]
MADSIARSAPPANQVERFCISVLDHILVMSISGTGAHAKPTAHAVRWLMNDLRVEGFDATESAGWIDLGVSGEPPEFCLTSSVAQTRDGIDDVEEACRTLLGVIALLLPVWTAESEIAVHAGGIEADGRAHILVGPSGAGKSTLVAALASRKAPVFGDETVLLDLDSLSVRGIARPMVLEPESAGFIPELPNAPIGSAFLPISAVTSPAEASPLGHIWFPRFDSAHSGAPTIRSLKPGQALLRFARECVSADVVEEQVLSRLLALLGSVPCSEIVHGDADLAAIRLLDLAHSLVNELPAGAPSVVPMSIPRTSEPTRPNCTRFAFATSISVLLVGDELVLAQQSTRQVVVLNDDAAKLIQGATPISVVPGTPASSLLEELETCGFARRVAEPGSGLIKRLGWLRMWAGWPTRWLRSRLKVVRLKATDS